MAELRKKNKDDDDTTAEDDKPEVKDESRVATDEKPEEKAEPPVAAPLATTDAGKAEATDEEEDEILPAQFGYRRYVYAAFFVFGIAIAYFLSKAGAALWYRLSAWTPKVGEPREDLMTPIAAVVAGLIVWLAYRRQDVRTLADEVALELSKVEWPTRKDVRRSTTIVVATTLGAAFIFWVYDFLCNHGVYYVATGEVVGSQPNMSIVSHWYLPYLIFVRVFAAGFIIWAVRALGLKFLIGSERS